MYFAQIIRVYSWSLYYFFLSEYKEIPVLLKGCPVRNISNTYQQHRHHIGEHVAWLQKKQINQKLQCQYIQTMASRPGLHSENIHRKAVACTMLQLLSLLSFVSSNNAISAVTAKNTDNSAVYKKEYLINKVHYQTVPVPHLLLVKNQHMTPHGFLPVSQIKSADNSITTMINSISHFIDYTEEIISRYSLLNIPMAAALPLTEDGQDSVIRINRYAPPKIKKTTPAPIIHDVKIVKLYDYSCLNDGEYRSFAEVLKRISQSLLQPVTMLAIESKNIASWNNGLGCPEISDIEKFSDVTQKIDDVISQIMGFLPYSKPLDIMQGIIAPLLGRIADDLMGKPVSREEELELLQQMIQQARISSITANYMGSRDQHPGARTKKTSLELPTFHILNGVNHIDLVRKGHVNRVPVIDRDGKVFALLSKYYKGKERLRQVYFNYLHRVWKITGNERFNRFSDRERYLAHRYSLGVNYQYQYQVNHRLSRYTVLNPYAPYPEILDAVEMFGQLVACRYQAGINKWFIYDATQPKGATYEIVVARNEWHLKLPVEEKVTFEILFSPEYGRDLKVDIVDKINNKNVYAQINTDAGFLWGNKFVLNKHGHLELLSPKRESDRYYKNEIRTSSISETKDNNNDVMFYEGNSGCFRTKRGMKLSHMCINPASESTSQFEQMIKRNKYPVIAEGSIGIVYDCNDGTVIKKYKGIIDERNKSRLRYANNNTKGFNRFYGPLSATISLTSNDNGSSSVFVRLKKIAGTPLNLIGTITDKNILNTMMNAIKSNTLDQELSVRLRTLGIVHYDINQANIIYDIKKGFSIIDFDSANFLPEGEKVNAEITKYMEGRFKYVFIDTLRDINAQLDKLNGNMNRKRVTL